MAFDHPAPIVPERRSELVRPCPALSLIARVIANSDYCAFSLLHLAVLIIESMALCYGISQSAIVMITRMGCGYDMMIWMDGLVLLLHFIGYAIAKSAIGPAPQAVTINSEVEQNRTDGRPTVLCWSCVQAASPSLMRS